MSPGTFMPSVPHSYYNNFYSVPQQYRYTYGMMHPQFYDRLVYRQPWQPYPTTTDYIKYTYTPNVGTSQSRTHSQSGKRDFTIAALLDIDNDSQNSKKSKYQCEGSCVKDNTEEFVSSTNCQPIQVSSSTSSDKVSEGSLEAEKKRSFQPFRVPSPLSSEPPSDISEGTTDTPQRQRRKKRVRTIFNSEQLDRLESEFERTQYLVGDERLQLASELNLNEAQVKIWFQNRRIKQRKQFDEIQKTAMAKLKSVRKESEEMHTQLSNTIKELSSLTASTEESSRAA